MNEAEFNPKLCDGRHGEVDRRLETLESSIESNLTRIYTKFEKVSEDITKRLPVWVTITISVLASACSGLLVALVRGN